MEVKKLSFRKAQQIMDVAQGMTGISEAIAHFQLARDLEQNTVAPITVCQLVTAMKYLSYEINGLTEDLDDYCET